MWKTIQQRLESSDSYISLVLGLAVLFVVGILVFNYTRKGSVTPATNTQTETQNQNAGTPNSDKYTVKEGDTLWSIAEARYKSGYNWVTIQGANNLEQPGMIEVGQVLVLPSAAPILVDNGGTMVGQTLSSATDTPSQPTVAPASGTYTVQHGDTLWSIAEARYKDGYKWTNIAQANNLGNPSLIHAGNVLTLP